MKHGLGNQRRQYGVNGFTTLRGPGGPEFIAPKTCYCAVSSLVKLHGPCLQKCIPAGKVTPGLQGLHAQSDRESWSTCIVIIKHNFESWRLNCYWFLCFRPITWIQAHTSRAAYSLNICADMIPEFWYQYQNYSLFSVPYFEKYRQGFLQKVFLTKYSNVKCY